MKVEADLPDEIGAFLDDYCKMKGVERNEFLGNLLCGDVMGIVDDMPTEDFLKLLNLSLLLSNAPTR